MAEEADGASDERDDAGITGRERGNRSAIEAGTRCEREGKEMKTDRMAMKRMQPGLRRHDLWPL